MNFTKKLLFVALVATTLLACQKDEVQTPIQSNDEQANSSIEFRSSSAGLDKELIDQWINWSNIQYDYNYLGKGILEKEYGKLALGFVYRYENANGQYTAIPFVSPNNTVKAVALTQLKGGVTSYHLYRGNTDISNSFNFSSQGGSGGTVAGLFGDLDYECEGDTGGGLFGGGGGCGGSDFYENADGGLRTLCLYEDCPNGHIYLKCRHPRILCDSDGIIIGNDGDNPPETGGGTPVVITFPTNPNGTSIPFFPSGGGSGGSYSLIFTRADLKDAISDFNDEHGVNLTYGQLLHSDPACLIFASISTSLNSTVGAGELERCMENAHIDELFDDCPNTISSEVEEIVRALTFESEILYLCSDETTINSIIEDAVDDLIGQGDCGDVDRFENAFNNEIENCSYDLDESPCWNSVLGQNMDQATFLSDWCNNFAGNNLGDFNDGGWFQEGEFPEIDADWRYLVDPTNNLYVIDMRHFLFVGFYLEMTTGLGNALGDIIELNQFLNGNPSGLMWQDFYSNRLGSAFARHISNNPDIDWDDDNTNLQQLICDFLDNPQYLYLRPFPNPEDCD